MHVNWEEKLDLAIKKKIQMTHTHNSDIVTLKLWFIYTY